jgi:hypothetical protein
MWKSPLAMAPLAAAAALAFSTMISPAEAQQVGPPAPAQVTAAQDQPTGTGLTYTGRPVARRDLALAVSDFPPVYEEGESLDLELFDYPLADRVIRRKTPGPGPDWIWTMTFQPDSPMTQSRMNFIADDMTIILNRSAADILTLNNWAQITSPTGLGDLAVQYTFGGTVKSDGTKIDGTLALFGSPDYVSFLVVMNTDGESATDLSDLAQIVTSRINTDRATRPR